MPSDLTPLTAVKPNRVEVLNGVAVRNRRLLPTDPENCEYKRGLVAAVRAAVQPGDRVVEVGPARGVCTVVAARQAGRDGDVVAFEAAREMVARARDTAALNRVEDRVTVHHAVIETGRDVYGTPDGASELAASELPACDVLVLDCEGAERTVLADLDGRPRAVVVESHPAEDSPPAVVADRLGEAGYRIIGREPVTDANPDNIVLRARRPESEREGSQ